MTAEDFKPGDRVKINALWYSSLPAEYRKLKWSDGIVVSFEEWERNTKSRKETIVPNCILLKHDAPIPHSGDRYTQWHPSFIEHHNGPVATSNTKHHKRRCEWNDVLLHGCRCGGV